MSQQLWCSACGVVGPVTESPSVWMCEEHRDLVEDAAWWAEHVLGLKNERQRIQSDLSQAEEHLHNILPSCDDGQEIEAGCFLVRPDYWRKLNLRRAAAYLETYNPDLFQKLSTTVPTVKIERRN